jgi:hypothetical protein
MTSALDEVIEGYAETAKDLVRKWRDYASGVATKLDSGYDADSASADLGVAMSLAIETGARLTWEALDAVAILTEAPSRPGWVESTQEFSSPFRGAKLELKGDLKNSPGQTLAAADVRVIPAQLGSQQTKFRIRANAAGYPAGIYRGKVLASTPENAPEEVSVRIQVP